MFGFILMTILFVACIEAQDADVSHDKTQCIEKFIEWCNGMKYPEEGSGISILSLAYHDESGFNRVFCSSDSEGSNCTKNGSPWFVCTPDHTLSYKGQVLSDTQAEVDDGICKTVDKVYNELSLQTFSLDNSTMTKLTTELESFFGEILAMQEQLKELQKRLSSVPFMDDDFWGGFGGGIFSRHPRPDTSEEKDSSKNNPSNDSSQKNPSNDSSQKNPSNDSNQIERE